MPKKLDASTIKRFNQSVEDLEKELEEMRALKPDQVMLSFWVQPTKL